MFLMERFPQKKQEGETIADEFEQRDEMEVIFTVAVVMNVVSTAEQMEVMVVFLVMVVMVVGMTMAMI